MFTQYALADSGRSSSAVAERMHDALCPSVVSFSSVEPRAQSFTLFIYHSPLHGTNNMRKK